MKIKLQQLLIYLEKKLEDYHVQKEEVDEVIYINFYDFLEMIKNKENETVYNYKDDSEMFLKVKDIIEKRRG